MSAGNSTTWACYPKFRKTALASKNHLCNKNIKTAIKIAGKTSTFIWWKGESYGIRDHIPICPYLLNFVFVTFLAITLQHEDFHSIDLLAEWIVRSHYVSSLIGHSNVIVGME
jgi:hypothetical protein